MKFQGANHDGLPQCRLHYVAHSLERGQVTCIQIITPKKKNEKFKKLPEKVQDKVKIREKDAAIEPDGQKIR